MSVFIVLPYVTLHLPNFLISRSAKFISWKLTHYDIHLLIIQPAEPFTTIYTIGEHQLGAFFFTQTHTQL